MPIYSVSVHEGDLFDACMAVLPPGLSFNFVTINKNLCCYPHRDVGNAGDSLILFLGKFEGGALVTEDGQRLEGTGVLHRFDGSRLHWNEPITGGTKYSIVFYNRVSNAVRTNCPRKEPGQGAQPLEAWENARVPFDLYAPR
jgi:hypothetical protein